MDLKKNGVIIINEILNNELSFYDNESEASLINRKESFYDVICSKRYRYTKNCLEVIQKHLADKEYEKAREIGVKASQSNLNYTKYNLNKQLNEILLPVNEWFQNKEKEKFSKMEKMILDYLNENKGKAFTYKAIFRRLTASIEDSSVLNFVKENFKGILNKLVHNHSISTQFHAGTNFYFIPS